MRKKSFFTLIILFLFPRSLFSHNGWHGSYAPPIIHIHNNVPTGGSSVFSAFKYFSLMVAAWEGGARFIGYSDFGFVNKVLKPVFNWLQKQTANSVSTFINYLRTKNSFTTNAFVDFVLEPMSQNFFRDTLSVESLQMRKQQDQKNHVIMNRLSVGDFVETAKIRLKQELVNDQIVTIIHDQNSNNKKDKNCNEQIVINDFVPDDDKILKNDQNKDQVCNQDIIIDKNVDEKNQHYPETIAFPFVEPQTLMQRFNPVDGSANNNHAQQQKVIVKSREYVPFASLFVVPHAADLVNKKNTKQELYALVDEFLKTEWQKGGTENKELIRGFYSLDPDENSLNFKKFPKFSKFHNLPNKFKHHLRVSFFVFVKSVLANPVPLSSQKSLSLYARGFGHYDVPKFYDERAEILEGMSRLYHWFEKNPQECLETIGVTLTSRTVFRGACL